MLKRGGDRASQVATGISAALTFLLGQDISMVNRRIEDIEREWQGVFDEAALSQVDRSPFRRRQFLNPFAFVDASAEVRTPQN